MGQATGYGEIGSSLKVLKVSQAEAQLEAARRLLLITKFIKEDSPFCLTRAITRTMIGLCYTPLSLAPSDTPQRCEQMK